MENSHGGLYYQWTIIDVSSAGTPFIIARKIKASVDTIKLTIYPRYDLPFSSDNVSLHDCTALRKESVVSVAIIEAKSRHYLLDEASTL